MPATAQSILAEIKPLGSDGYKRVLMNHGVTEPCFGVKIEELKKIQKRIKMDYRLALDLYDTGNYDARYLAGLIADDAKMTKQDLQHWLKTACPTTAGWTATTVAAGSPHGYELALEWIESDKDMVSAAGWGTLSALVSIKPDEELDHTMLRKLLQRVERTIHKSPNATRYKMNSFVIAVGSYVKSLNKLAIQTGEKIGVLTVDMGNTSCKVPFAPDYIRKVEKRGTIGKKRKSAKC
jgi:3-methyladenine DNA glycosylase AlkD